MAVGGHPTDPLVAKPRFSTPVPTQGGRPLVMLVSAAADVKAMSAQLGLDVDVTVLESGDSALRALATRWPDVVLLDLELPDMPGLEVCRQLKQRAVRRALPVMLVAAPPRAAELVTGVEAGADDLILRPVHPLELKARVAHLLKLTRLEADSVAAGRIRSLRAQLEEAERMATLGTFAAGVAHELNNATSVLGTVLSEATRSATLDEDLRLDLKEATERLKELSRAMLHVANPGRSDGVLDLREVVRDVVWMTRLTGRTKYCTTALDVPPAPVLASVSRAEAQQVLLNLIINAAESFTSPTWGKVSVVLRNGERAVLSVIDDGPGLSAEAMANLFQPLFSTKAAGTGLGLVMVKQIVEGWGGEVSVRSEPGKGTRVDVVLDVMK